jgi:hypothetical protein
MKHLICREKWNRQYVSEWRTNTYAPLWSEPLVVDAQYLKDAYLCQPEIRYSSASMPVNVPEVVAGV